jgi:hypothetical protein
MLVMQEQLELDLNLPLSPQRCSSEIDEGKHGCLNCRGCPYKYRHVQKEGALSSFLNALREMAERENMHG